MEERFYIHTVDFHNLTLMNISLPQPFNKEELHGKLDIENGC